LTSLRTTSTRIPPGSLGRVLPDCRGYSNGHRRRLPDCWMVFRGLPIPNPRCKTSRIRNQRPGR
jgi:hypothetical protein